MEIFTLFLVELILIIAKRDNLCIVRGVHYDLIDYHELVAYDVFVGTIYENNNPRKIF